jgi:hypothetical protein
MAPGMIKLMPTVLDKLELFHRDPYVESGVRHVRSGVMRRRGALNLALKVLAGFRQEPICCRSPSLG